MLGFIFEKYINQKQMGAYYTFKEDINTATSAKYDPTIPVGAKTR
jgi:hypothetical protein